MFNLVYTSEMNTGALTQLHVKHRQPEKILRPVLDTNIPARSRTRLVYTTVVTHFITVLLTFIIIYPVLIVRVILSFMPHGDSVLQRVEPEY